MIGEINGSLEYCNERLKKPEIVYCRLFVGITYQLATKLLSIVVP